MIKFIIRILKMSINAEINVIQDIAIFIKILIIKCFVQYNVIQDIALFLKILIIKWYVNNYVNKAKKFIKTILTI